MDSASRAAGKESLDSIRKEAEQERRERGEIVNPAPRSTTPATQVIPAVNKAELIRAKPTQTAQGLTGPVRTRKRQSECCFARRHLEMDELAYYEYARALSKGSGIFYRNDRRDAVEFNTSKSRICRIAQAVERKGFFKLLEAAKRLPNGHFTSIQYKPLSHQEWAASHLGQCFASPMLGTRTSPTDGARVSQNQHMACPTGAADLSHRRDEDCSFKTVVTEGCEEEVSPALSQLASEIGHLHPKNRHLKDKPLPEAQQKAIVAAIKADGPDAVRRGTNVLRIVAEKFWEKSERNFIPGPKKFYGEREYLKDFSDWGAPTLYESYLKATNTNPNPRSQTNQSFNSTEVAEALCQVNGWSSADMISAVRCSIEYQAKQMPGATVEQVGDWLVKTYREQSKRAFAVNAHKFFSEGYYQRKAAGSS